MQQFFIVGQEHKENKLIECMKSDTICINEKIEKLKMILDIQEQHVRQSCHLQNSIAESEHENTDDLMLETLNEKMHVNLIFSTLDRTHHIGQKKSSSNKSKAVIIKFIWKKITIFFKPRISIIL